MGEPSGTGPGAKPAGETAVSSPVSRARANLWQIATFCIGAALIIGAIFYGTSFARSNAFHDERAFRVLDDISAQFRNLETSRVTLLSSVPASMRAAAPPCVPPESEGQQATRRSYMDRFDVSDAEVSRRAFTSYHRRLDLDADLCVHWKLAPAAAAAPVSGLAKVLDDACAASLDDEVALTVNLEEDRFTSVQCGKDMRAVLRESLEKSTSRFVSQEFFDEALFALADGTVIGEFVGRDPNARTSRVLLQPVIAERLNILNAQGLLAWSAEDSGDRAKEADPSKPRASVPAGLVPLAVTRSIGGQSYRVFVLPFRNPYKLILSGQAEAGRGDRVQRQLYIVGLQRLALTDQVLHALWPHGMWILTLLICLNLVAWPLISLAFGPAEESFSVRKAISCAVGVIVVPALFTVAAASIWSGFELQAWMRQQARAYLQSLSQEIHQDLIDGARILESYRPFYAPFSNLPVCRPAAGAALQRLLEVLPGCSSKPTAGAPFIGFDGAGHERSGCAVQALADQCGTVRLRQADTGAERPLTWSAIRSLIAINRDGERFGPSFTVFNDVPVSKTLNLRNREYFQSLEQGDGWTMPAGQPQALQLVAQRLFNRGDASKALQIAVPLCGPGPEGRASAFCGVITGDLRMHSLIAAVSPPLLKFAVIDATTGTVLFHSNDSRGLAENFFRESERNAALFGAMKARRSAEFSGRYLGDPYRFFYGPLQGTPWGLVVMYSKKDLGDLPFRAGSAALSEYAGLVVFGIIGFFFIRALAMLRWPGAWSLPGLACKLWPRLPLTERHRHISRFRPAVWALIVLAIALLRGWSPWLGAALALGFLVAVAAVGFLVKPATERKSARPPVQQYVGYVMAVVTVLAIIPAYALFVRYHRLQFDALVRDGLVESGYQVQRRHELIRQDLRRWISADALGADEQSQFPDAWTLTLDPDFNMRSANRRIPEGLRISEVTQQSPAVMLDAHAPGLIQSMVWQATVGSPVQEQRLALLEDSVDPEGAADVRCGTPALTRVPVLARQATVNASARDRPTDEVCVMRSGDGTAISLRTGAAPRGILTAQPLSEALAPTMAVLAAMAAVALGSAALCNLFARRLIGLDASYARRHAKTDQPCPTTPAEFKARWDRLKPPDRLVLYQLALGHLANPRNDAAIDRLLDEQLIRLGPWPMLREPALKRFVLGSQTATEFAAWQNEAARGVWKTVRIPLFIVLMALIAWLSWSAGGFVKATSAIMLGSLAVLTPLAQLVNMARSGLGAQGKSGG